MIITKVNSHEVYSVFYFYSGLYIALCLYLLSSTMFSFSACHLVCLLLMAAIFVTVVSFFVLYLDVFSLVLIIAI